MHLKSIYIPALAFAALSLAGWTYYRGQVRQQVTLRQFAKLEHRIAANNLLTEQKTKKYIHWIKHHTIMNRMQVRDVNVLRQAEQIGLRTHTLIDTLQNLRRELSAPENQAQATLQPLYSKVTVSKATASALASHLNRYLAFIRQVMPNAASSTQGITTFPYLDKSRALYTELLPMEAVLASITQTETQIRRHSEEALNDQAQRVNYYCDLCVDRIALAAVAESKTVAPGAIYRGQLFLGQTISDKYFTQATVNDEPVRQIHPGQAQAVFRAAPAGPAQPDTIRVQWQGKIWAKGYQTDTVWQLRVPYFIVKTAMK